MDSDRTASLMTPAKLAQVKPMSAASPVAWLNQMAADAGHSHVARLSALCHEVDALLRDPARPPLADALANLATALPQLDFGLLQARGWWARASGKQRSAGAEFGRQFEEIEEVARLLAAQVQPFQNGQRTQGPVLDRAVLEFEVEFRALDKIVDQGSRWLEDMRAQLNARRATDLDAPGRQQLRDDAARCEILVARLKGLRRVSASAQDTYRRIQAASGRRRALLALLPQIVGMHLKAWQARVSALAGAASEGQAPASSPDAAMEMHRELQLSVKQAVSDCAQLRAEEQAAQVGLAEFGVQLQSLS